MIFKIENRKNTERSKNRIQTAQTLLQQKECENTLIGIEGKNRQQPYTRTDGEICKNLVFLDFIGFIYITSAIRWV